MHVLLHVLGSNVADVDVEHSSFGGTDNSVCHHSIFEQSKLSPNTTGRFKDRGTIRGVLVVTKNTEVSYLPVLESDTTRVPLKLNIVWICGVFSFQSFYFVGGQTYHIFDTFVLVKFHVKEVISVLTHGTTPTIEVKLYVDYVVEQVVKDGSNLFVLTLDMKHGLEIG